MNSLLFTILNAIELICVHTIKRFQVLLFIVDMQLHGLKYSYLILKIRLNINHWFVSSHSNGFLYIVVSKGYSCICSQLYVF